MHNLRSQFQLATLGLLAVLLTGCDLHPNNNDVDNGKEKPKLNTTTEFTNHLAGEKSPYLLQHAHNPVDWFPWGKEAFEKARREDKPIFLSIGYSTCHWCHVMAHESFENKAVADIMNKYFVCIKVDREERPDVDKVYMTYVQLATGGGGWPMSVWLTPDLKPFVGGTYFPLHDQYGRPGFTNVLKQIADAWKNDRKGIIAASDGVVKKLREITAVKSNEDLEIDKSMLDTTYNEIKATYDPEEGGFGGAPKFPQPSELNFMLRYYSKQGAQDALDMTLFTLRKMARGGIYDHIGGGFHRYSVDARWHVPHFEKMLYDQAQLVCTYLDAYQITHKEIFADVAKDILKYVHRDMTGDQGQFYTAEDADSARPDNPKEHAEGAFYVWGYDEIVRDLPEEQASLFNYIYDVKQNGNVRSDPQKEFANKNVLIAVHTQAEAAKHFNKSVSEVDQLLKQARKTLFEIRTKRPRPHLDDKTITAWNGLMISGFARAYQILEDKNDLNAARKAADFIKQNLYDQKHKTLLRDYRQGAAKIEGYSDDYAYLIQGLLDLYEACFDQSYLDWAVELQDTYDRLFWDNTSGGYFSTSGKDDTILLRMKERYDGAEPAPNSIATLNLLRLSQLTGRNEYRVRSEKILQAFSINIKAAPQAMPQMMVALDYYLDTPRQFIIAGNPDSPDTRALLHEIHKHFIPNKALILTDGKETPPAATDHEKFIRSHKRIEGKATVYMCENFTCKLPVNNPKTLADIISKMDEQTMNN